MYVEQNTVESITKLDEFINNKHHTFGSEALKLTDKRYKWVNNLLRVPMRDRVTIICKFYPDLIAKADVTTASVISIVNDLIKFELGKKTKEEVGLMW